jgi:hypothetical protein
MRSQVQVLAGPLPIPAGHSAVGSEPEVPAASLGRAGAARPSPPARPSALPDPPTRAAGPMTTTHRGRPLSPGRQPRDRCGNLTLQPAPLPTAQPLATALLTPAWPAWSRSRASAAARRHLTWPDPLTNATSAAPPASGPARPSIEPLQDAAAHRDSTRSRGDGCKPRPGPHRRRPSGRTAADSSRLDTGRPDTGRLDTGRAGHRMHWTPDGWTLDG